jgi:hypothetical protein
VGVTSGIDWSAVGQSALDGMGWGIGFAVPFFVGITWAVLRILSHPSVRAIARAADKLSGKSGGVLEQIVGGGLKALGLVGDQK